MRECRACRQPIPDGMLACKPHWFMLQPFLRQRIMAAYRGGAGVASRSYVAAVTDADSVWKQKGVWKPATNGETA